MAAVVQFVAERVDRVLVGGGRVLEPVVGRDRGRAVVGLRHDGEGGRPIGAVGAGASWVAADQLAAERRVVVDGEFGGHGGIEPAGARILIRRTTLVCPPDLKN